MQRQQQRQPCTGKATANGNGETATEEWQRNGGNWALLQVRLLQFRLLPSVNSRELFWQNFYLPDDVLA